MDWKKGITVYVQLELEKFNKRILIRIFSLWIIAHSEMRGFINVTASVHTERTRGCQLPHQAHTTCAHAFISMHTDTSFYNVSYIVMHVTTKNVSSVTGHSEWLHHTIHTYLKQIIIHILTYKQLLQIHANPVPDIHYISIIYISDISKYMKYWQFQIAQNLLSTVSAHP